MAMVDVDSSGLSAESQSVLAWFEGWRPPGAQSTFVKFTMWAVAISLPWWQRQKDYHGHYYYHSYDQFRDGSRL